MQSATLQAGKIQASLAAKSAGVATSRAAVQALRPQAPTFVKCPTQIVHSVRGGVTVSAVADLPSSSPALEDDSAPPSPRRSINDFKFQLKFVVPNSITGALMGVGGTNVVAITNKTGAFVQASRAGSAVSSPRDRMITIAADSAGACKAAMRLLLDSLALQGVDDRLERFGYNTGQYFLKQVIPAPCAGKVLGPAGDMIQQICFMTGASVVIQAKPVNAAFIPYRYVNYMSPSLEKLADAIDRVSDLLNEDDRYMPAIREINSVALKVVSIPAARAGSLIGPGGSYIKMLQDVMKVKLGICEGNKPGSRFVTVWGAPSNVNVALDLISVATGGIPAGAAAGIREDLRTSDYGNDAGGDGGGADTPRSSTRNSYINRNAAAAAGRGGGSDVHDDGHDGRDADSLSEQGEYGEMAAEAIARAAEEQARRLRGPGVPQPPKKVVEV